MSLPQEVGDRDGPIIFASVEVEGDEERRVDLSEITASMEFTDEEKGADVLKLVVDNYSGNFHDDPLFDEGNVLTLTWGYPGIMSPTRSMVIKKAKGSRLLTIEAHARSVLLHNEKKSRTFRDMTHSEIVAKIAGEHGYSGDGAKIEELPETEKEDVVNQAGMTDATFLKRLAHKHGFEFFIDFDGLHWEPRKFDQAPIRELRWYTDPDKGLIKSYSVETDLSAKPGKVTLAGIDPRKKSKIEESGSNDETTRDVLQEVVEVRDTETGEWIKKTRTAQQSTESTPEDNASKAKRRADAKYRKVQQRSVELKLDVIGDPLYLAKTVVLVTGLGKRLSGRYYIEKVVHRISSGYGCTLECITDGTRGRSGISVDSALQGAGTKKGSGAGSVDDSAVSLTAVLKDAIGTVINLTPLVHADSPAGANSLRAIRKQMEGGIRALGEDPTNKTLYLQIESLGVKLSIIGVSVGKERIDNAGKAVVSAARTGHKAAKSAKTKGKLNTKPVDLDRAGMVSGQVRRGDQWVTEFRPKKG